MSAIPESRLLPAWDDPVHDAQSTFRTVLKALSEPGLIQTIAKDVECPAPMFASTAALCLTLADFETSVWLDRDADNAALIAYLRFHCGCRLAGAMAEAGFAVVTDARQLGAGYALEKFAQGTMEYPDRSTTLFVQVPGLDDGPTRYLSGPGIAHRHAVNVSGLPECFDAMWQKNTAGFPMGVDLVFCHGPRILGLPRTTAIVA
ncbi:phosphonate C-P lyase system protein PhnH [Oxalobacteraceae bacterium CAVE-383]|nr:phosphonate C-P lyase system protein PhnH [Oxalobacteraceae bacterium CAVE-383]